MKGERDKTEEKGKIGKREKGLNKYKKVKRDKQLLIKRILEKYIYIYI